MARKVYGVFYNDEYNQQPELQALFSTQRKAITYAKLKATEQRDSSEGKKVIAVRTAAGLEYRIVAKDPEDSSDDLGEGKFVVETWEVQ